MGTITRALALVGFLAAGCTGYRPAPLDPDAEWSRLEGIRLEDLKAEGAPGEGAVPPFDYRDGLSSDEAAGLAVALNPGLSALRAEKGVAEAELLAAGLLPNPEIDTKWLRPEDASVWTGEATALFDLTRLLLSRGPEKARARLRAEEVDWEIAEREWQVASEARLAFVDLLYADEAGTLNERRKGIADRNLAMLRARLERGAATGLEVALAEAEAAGIARDGKRLAGDRRLALQALNRLLGLPPSHDTRLKKPEKPLAFVRSEGTLAALAEGLRSRRPSVLAAQRAYGASERSLELAYRKRLPAVKVGPAWERGEDRGQSFGVGASIEIPLLDRGQGEIAGRTAEREKARRVYLEALQSARDELSAAWAERETVEAEVRVDLDDVAPKLDRGLELTQKAFEAGDLGLLQVLEVQTRVLDARRDLLGRLRDLHRARIKVQQAAGPAPPPAP